jgi:hypothetical protein
MAVPVGATAMDSSQAGSYNACFSPMAGASLNPVYSVVHRDTATRQSNPDSALAYFEKNKVTHVMLANLRANPREPGMGVINTIHHILYPVMEKYPQKLRLVHTEGEYEECQVFEFVYH